MAKQNGDKRNYCAGHKVLKTWQEQVFFRKNKFQNGNKTELLSQRGKSYSPKGGQVSCAFTQINNMKTRGTQSSPIADEYCVMLKMRAKCSGKIVQRMNSTQNGMSINI